MPELITLQSYIEKTEANQLAVAVAAAGKCGKQNKVLLFLKDVGKPWAEHHKAVVSLLQALGTVLPNGDWQWNKEGNSGFSTDSLTFVAEELMAFFGDTCDSVFCAAMGDNEVWRTHSKSCRS